MQRCNECVHDPVCQYKPARMDAEKFLGEQDSEELWPFYVEVRCQRFDRADLYRVGPQPFTEAPDWFKRGPSCGTTYEQVGSSGVTSTLKGGGEDGK